MIFPIGDDNIEGGFKPIIAYSFLLINVLVFFLELSMGPQYEQFLFTYGTIPNEITNGVDYFTLLTSMFLHGGWMHLIGNMLFLWIFADNIEAVVGSFIFFLFYLFGGLFASATHILTDPNSLIPTVGASGAISAVMGAYLIMFPKSRIKILFILFFSKFHLPAIAFLGLWFAQQLISGIGNIGPQSAEEGGGVAWWAHIGGFVYGLIVGWLFKIKFGHRYKYSTPAA